MRGITITDGDARGFSADGGSGSVLIDDIEVNDGSSGVDVNIEGQGTWDIMVTGSTFNDARIGVDLSLSRSTKTVFDDGVLNYDILIEDNTFTDPGWPYPSLR